MTIIIITISEINIIFLLLSFKIIIKTCEQKESVLIDDFNQIINLTEFQRDYKATTASGCKLIPNIGTNNESWYRCIHHRTFQSHRERWWFIAIDNCGTSKGLYMKYRITMTNSQTNAWLKHFSADEFCMTEMISILD